MNIETVVVGDLGVNCYIVSVENKAIVIDPGDEYNKIKEALKGKTVEAILLTHGHFDHTGAVKKFQDDGAKVYISKEDAKMLVDGYTSLANPFGYQFTPIKADVTFNDNDVLELIDIKIKVILTPGHTKGSACFLCDNILFSGDTLFYRSIGRTDFPGGDFETISHSIRNKLYVLNEETVVLSGHGNETTIKEEKCSNMFVR
ncbi:MAG: MBL fold metallo-hydrolase [Clostridiales bacterium]|nr:MBL fold metallo-hydrolase [Clostridiales bacterium]